MAFLSNTPFILIMILGFGVLIFVHEMGHFIAAKWAGIRTEAFAIGMGPVICSWRKGIGCVAGSTHRRVVARTGKAAADLSDGELAKHELGETEYSLRWIPLGGFVKMLGQEDANPNYVSDDPRSYNSCPVGKRMIVVSAGVIMNVIFGAILYIIAFMAGVQFDAPVIGDVFPSMPAATAVATNAEALGVTRPGIQSGDTVLTIDGQSAKTFADVQIATAYARPGQSVHFSIRRSGVSDPLEFNVTPTKDPRTGLLGVGLLPASSTTLHDDETGVVLQALRQAGLAQQGVQPGMTLVRAGDTDIDAIESLSLLADASEGEPITTEWSSPDGATVTATLDVTPGFEILRIPDAPADAIFNFDRGLLGLVPLVKIVSTEGSPNADVLFEGDVVLRVNDLIGPRESDFRQEVAKHAGEPVKLQLLRGEQIVEVTAEVDRSGKLNVLPGPAYDLPLVAESLRQVKRITPSGAAETVATPAASIDLLPTSAIVSIDGFPTAGWSDIRSALRTATEDAFSAGEAATVQITVAPPLAESANETVTMQLTPDDVARLHHLGWEIALNPSLFEPKLIVLDAGGNPLQAVLMGLRETQKALLLTYLTFDRLIRGSVGVEQLRGPVGIVHIGTRILPKGFMYFLFFLGLISINLAVINFLPLPIVDGGLFLFLIYEKIKGRPPAPSFQWAATIVGIMLIGAVFLITFYNDIMRLIEGGV